MVWWRSLIYNDEKIINLNYYPIIKVGIFEGQDCIAFCDKSGYCEYFISYNSLNDALKDMRSIESMTFKT